MQYIVASDSEAAKQSQKQIATPPYGRLAMTGRRLPRLPYGRLAMTGRLIARAPYGSPRIYGYRFLKRYWSPPLLLDHPHISKL